MRGAEKTRLDQVPGRLPDAGSFGKVLDAATPERSSARLFAIVHFNELGHVTQPERAQRFVECRAAAAQGIAKDGESRYIASENSRKRSSRT